MVGSPGAGRIQDRVAIVTGGASGIGQAIAARFVAEGARVLVMDIDAEGAAAVGRDLSPDGSRCRVVAGDATDEHDVRSAVDGAVAYWGGLDIAVANAGIEGAMREITAVSVDDWDRLMAVNARGPFLLARESVPHLRERGGGSIVVVSSNYAFVGNPMTAAYCASKGASLAFARALAVDVVQHGIRVNAICPGNVRTPMFDRALRMQHDDVEAAYGAYGRLADPSEIASVALFLASDESSYMTGASLVVDYGETVRPGPVWGSTAW